MYLLNGYKIDIDSVTCPVYGMTFKEVFTFIYGVSMRYIECIFLSGTYSELYVNAYITLTDSQPALKCTFI
jgi:hypothetical protein